jgi:hypothetical protein
MNFICSLPNPSAVAPRKVLEPLDGAEAERQPLQPTPSTGISLKWIDGPDLNG